MFNSPQRHEFCLTGPDSSQERSFNLILDVMKDIAVLKKVLKPDQKKGF